MTGARHPIAVVAERTGLSQDVLRVWERRYAAVRPVRDQAGQRLYTDAEIDRFALLKSVTRSGRSIGQVARLPSDALAALAAEDQAAREARATIASQSPEVGDVVSASLALARMLDASALDEALRRAAVLMGMSSFLESVAAPLLRRVGDEWHAGRLSPAHEHMVTSALHDIIVAMMRAFGKRAGAPAVLVATAAGEHHVVGAALVGAAAAAEGWNVLYLGSDLPGAEIADAAKAAGVRVVAVSVVYIENRARVLDELRIMRERLPKNITLLAGGAGAASLEKELSAMNIRLESSVSGLLSVLRHERGSTPKLKAADRPERVAS